MPAFTDIKGRSLYILSLAPLTGPQTNEKCDYRGKSCLALPSFLALWFPRLYTALLQAIQSVSAETCLAPETAGRCNRGSFRKQTAEEIKEGERSRATTDPRCTKQNKNPQNTSALFPDATADYSQDNNGRQGNSTNVGLSSRLATSYSTVLQLLRFLLHFSI